MRRALGKKQGYPWSGHFINLTRMKDWLALLDSSGGGRFGAYAPPLHHTKWLNRFAFMEKAGDRWVGGERWCVFSAWISACRACA